MLRPHVPLPLVRAQHAAPLRISPTSLRDCNPRAVKGCHQAGHSQKPSGGASAPRERRSMKAGYAFLRPRREFPAMSPGRRALVIAGLAVSALLFLGGFAFAISLWH